VLWAWPDGRVASTSALAPAGWVLTSAHRCSSRCSDSLSPSGNAASKRAQSCTSGRSRTASTRLARLPGVMCPDSARSDARAVPSGPGEAAMAARGKSGMPAPGPPGFAAVPLSWPGHGRSRSPGPLGTRDRRHHACTTRWPGPASTRAAPRARWVRDGDDPPGGSRERPSRAATGWLTPGTKMIQRVLRRSGRYCGRSRIS